MSTTSPPPYTSSHSSTTSKKHKSSSAEKDKEKDKDRDRDKDNNRYTKTRDDLDDVFSLKSRSTNSSSATDHSNVSTTTTTTTVDTLRLISGNGVRRSKCRADYLEDLARGSGGLAVLGKGIAEKLNIIAGKDGIAFFRKFIREIPFEAGLRSEEEKRELQRRLSNPVVFAVRVVDAGRKVLDYYMTWRGKTARAKDIKGPERRVGLLDDEFRRVARTIDKEYKRSSHDDSHSHKSPKSKRHHSSPSIVVSPPDLVPDTQLPGTPTGKRTSSANDSVISLPFLGTVRNVPTSYRLPLRVTNPDRNSLVDPSLCESPVTQTAPKNTSLETLVEATEPVESAPGDPERQASFDTLVQASDADHKLAPKKEKRRKSYAESISSTGSRSSRSSRRTHRRHDRSRSRKSSPVRNHHESSSKSKSERKEHGHSSSSRHKDGDEDGGPSTRKRHSTRHRDEKREKDEDDRSSHKSSRKNSEKPLESNITLVILDPEEVDRESVREATKHAKKETLTRNGSAWHKVAAPRRLTKPTPTTVTPWTGPLARESDGIRNINPKRSHNHDSDESDEWVDIPQRVTKTGSFVASPPSSDYSSDDDDFSRSPSPMGDRHSPDFSPNTYHQHSNPLSPPPPSTHGLLPPPVNPYRHASPQTMPYHLSSPPPPTVPFGFISPAPSTHTPGLIPSSHFSPAGSNASLYTYLAPGYIPSSYHSPNHSLYHTTTLSSIHSISDSVSAANAAAMTHGSASPYLYSTPRPTHSPYVPAWISPASSVNLSLPGSLTPTSPRGAVLHSGGYAPSSGGGSVY